MPLAQSCERQAQVQRCEVPTDRSAPFAREGIARRPTSKNRPSFEKSARAPDSQKTPHFHSLKPLRSRGAGADGATAQRGRGPRRVRSASSWQRAAAWLSAAAARRRQQQQVAVFTAAAQPSHSSKRKHGSATQLRDPAALRSRLRRARLRDPAVNATARRPCATPCAQTASHHVAAVRVPDTSRFRRQLRDPATRHSRLRHATARPRAVHGSATHRPYKAPFTAPPRIDLQAHNASIYALQQIRPFLIKMVTRHWAGRPGCARSAKGRRRRAAAGAGRAGVRRRRRAQRCGRRGRRRRCRRRRRRHASASGW
jgi:hypothetical protein